MSKTPKELNEIAAKFWTEENEKFCRLAEQYPHDLADAAELASKLIKHGFVNHPDFLAETSLNAAMHETEWRRQRDQSMRASERAAKRHAPTNQQKAAALAAWDVHGANVSSMAAFARARHKEFGVTERTLYEWVRDHRKANS